MYDTEDITVHDVWWGRVEPLSFTIPPTVTLPSIVTYEYRYVYWFLLFDVLHTCYIQNFHFNL